MKMSVRLRDKETGRESKEIDIEEIIYNQSEVEFEFGEFLNDDYETLPYKDFLFFANDYDVIIKSNNFIE